MKQKVITYSLLQEQDSSDGYYEAVSEFASRLLDESRSMLTVVRSFMGDTAINDREPLRSELEYLTEFLALGVYWRVYSPKATSTLLMPHGLFTYLADLRQKDQNLKPAVDWVRGIGDRFCPLV